MKSFRLALCMLVATVSAAAAHAMLEKASPGAGAVVPAPGFVSLEFSEELEPSFSDIAVSDASGRDVTAGSVNASGASMQVRLKIVPAGVYRVHWHAVSIDTHRTEGAYSFIVNP